MQKFGKSQSTPRREDPRLLTGRGRYIDDIAPAGALRALFLRSDLAHGRIAALDCTAARAAPGVCAVLTAADLPAAGLAACDLPATVLQNRDGSRGADPRRPILAEGRVRFVGEPIACVVAETRAQAEDALALIELELEELPAKLDLAPGGEALHPAEAPDNLAFDWAMGDEAAVDAALAGAAHLVRVRVHDNRVTAASMEPRGCLAEPLPGGRLHLAFGGQGVWDMKRALARAFAEPAGNFRVTNPDVGGGFGMKAGPYPEYFAVAAACRLLGRPVRWFATRFEAMAADNGGRGVDSLCTLGFDADHRITAYKVENLSDLGAYNADYGQGIQSVLFAKVLTGAYAVEHAFLRCRGIYTNTAQVDAYRGAGRPEAIYALERSMDYAARRLGVDPWELRRRNFITRFPWRSATGELYDVGDFPRLLARAEAEADRAGFAARRARSQARGRLRGLGLCYYIESILGSPEEDATVEFLPDGSVNLYVGTQSNGQGHETVFAQFLADQTGIPAEAIRVVQGDSDRIATGGGTGGSRSVTTQGNATLVAAQALIAGFAAFLAEEHGVAEVRFDDMQFRIPGTNAAPSMLEAAALARARGRADLLRLHRRARLPGRSYPNGAHVAEVEIDPETGRTWLRSYRVVDDFGNLVNPMLVRGQVRGGVAQGAGQALMEQVAFDGEGQLLSASMMDYALPRADQLPFVQVQFQPVPSTANALGMKGCGEAGTVGSMAAVANACMDALAQAGVSHADMPFTPARVWALLQAARAAAPEVQPEVQAEVQAGASAGPLPDAPRRPPPAAG